MSRQTKIIFLFFLLILLSSFASAKQETEIQLSDGEGLQIVYPKSLTFEPNQQIILNFDILNTTKHKLNSSNADCTFYSSDYTGLIISKGSLNYNLTYNHWNYVLTEENERNEGVYSSYVYCNATNQENGFISFSYEIEESKKIDSQNIAFEGIIGVGVILLFIIILFSVLPQTHFILKLLLLGMGIWLLVLIPNLLLNGYQAITTLNKSVQFIPLMIISYIIFYFIYEVLRFKGVIKSKK